MSDFTFTGINRSGAVVVGGFTAESCVKFVEGAYLKRWQSLSVIQKGYGECGAILLHPDNDKRTWWAEAAETKERVLP